MNKIILVLLGLCLLVFAIAPVMAADPTCSFCEFINISKGDPGPANMTMNLTANMTAGMDGINGTNGVSGGTGGQVLFFQHPYVSSPPTYEGLSPIPNGGSEADELVSPTGGTPVLFDSYITDIGYPGITVLPAGLWRFRTYHYVSLSSGDSRVIFTVLNRTAGGTETPLFSVMSEEINQQTTPIEYLTSYTQTSNYTISPTDRIVINVYGNTTGVARDVHFVYQGSTHTSHVQTPLEVISSLYVRLDGSTPFQGSQSMGGFNLTNVSNPIGLQDAATKSYVDSATGGDTTSFLFTNGSRIMTGIFNAGKFNVSNITTVAGGDAVNLTLVTNMNTSLMNNVSQYVLAVNETIKNNMSSLTGGFTNQTYVDNVNTSMRNNVSQYVIAVNNTQIINISLSNATMKTYVDNVNTTMKSYVDGLGGTNQTYVDNVNASMRNNVSQYVIAVNNTVRLNMSWNNDTMRNNVSQYVLAVNETIKNNMTALTAGYTNQTYVDNVNASMRNNVSQYVILVNTTNMNNMSQYVLAVNETIKNNMSSLTGGFTNQTYVDNVNASMRNNVSQYVIVVNDTMRNNVSQYILAVNETIKNNMTSSTPIDTSSFLFLNGSRMMGGTLNMSSHNISGVIFSVGTDAVNKDYVDNVNTSMRNNVSQYIIAVNDSMRLNVSQNYITTAYVDNVNDSMRNNVSQYVIAVNNTVRLNMSWNNDTMRNNVSQYVIAVNDSMRLNVSQNYITTAYVDNVNASMRNNVSQYVIAVNNTVRLNMSWNNDTMRNNVSQYVIAVNDTMRNNVSQYVIAVNNSMKAYVDGLPSGGDTSSFLFLNGSRWMTGNLNMSKFNVSNITTVAGGDAVNLTLVTAINTTMRNNVSQAIATTTNLSAVYPIGSVYITTLATDPHDIFGGFGTWNNMGSGYVLIGV